MNVTIARAPSAPGTRFRLADFALLALLLAMVATAASGADRGDVDRPSAEGAAAAPAAAKSATADPVGDTFGTGGLAVDVTYFSARTTDDELLIDLSFTGQIAAPSSGADNAVVGFIDLDVDGAAASGDVPFVDFLTDFASGLGSDFYVDLLSHSPDDGRVDLMKGSGEVAGRVPLTLTGSALGVRIPLALLGGDAVRAAAVVGTAAEATDAVPNGGSLAASKIGDEVLLNGDRFEVQVAWKDFSGNLGSGTLAVRSEDSAVFWFFTADNWELMIKVLDGCGLNDRFWVFAAATTDVEYTLTVRDTATGKVKQYFNPLGTAAAAINDTDAFDSCP